MAQFSVDSLSAEDELSSLLQVLEGQLEVVENQVEELGEQVEEAIHDWHLEELNRPYMRISTQNTQLQHSAALR